MLGMLNITSFILWFEQDWRLCLGTLPLPFIFVMVLFIGRIKNSFISTAGIAMTSYTFTAVLASITCSTPTPLPKENILAVCTFLDEKRSTSIFLCIFGIPLLLVE